MINHDFIKELKVLYVEDDANIRYSLTPILTKMFGEVYTANDGVEGIEFYMNKYENGERIDAIISDINMPRKNGLEFLEEVRAIDENMPFIFTTAHTDSEYLLEAIKHGVSEYVIKPINVKDVVSHVQKVCEKRYSSRLLKQQKKELEQYLDVIDKVAIISRTDLKGNILFVNDIFCEVAGYDREELIGKPHNVVRHQDMPSSAFQGLWEEIRQGNVWKGKVKNRAKDGSPYFVNATIIPVYDEYGKDVIEYMGIRFLTTDEENEKREFKKKVLENIQESKKQQMEYTQKIKELEEKLKQFEHVDLIYNNLENEKKKAAKLHVQVEHYEKEIIGIRNKNQKLISDANQKVAKAASIATTLKSAKDRLELEVKKMKLDVDSRDATILKMNEQLNNQNKYIADLKDVIKHREDQLSKLGVK